MPKPKKGPRLGSGPAHQKLLLSTLAAQLFVHEAHQHDRGEGEGAPPVRREADHEGEAGRPRGRREVLKRHPRPRRRAQAVPRDRPTLRGAPGRLHAHPEARAAQGRRRADGADRAGRAGESRSRGAPARRGELRRARVSAGARVRRDRVPRVGAAAGPAIRTVEGGAGAMRSARAPGASRKLSVAGRTDAGVHARGRSRRSRRRPAVRTGAAPAALNAMLAPEVVVIAGAATRRKGSTRASRRPRGEYRYRIDEAPLADPFTARFVWHRPGRLALGADARGGAATRRGARLRVVLPPAGRRAIHRSGELQRLTVARRRRGWSSASGRTRSCTRWCGPSSGRSWPWGRGRMHAGRDAARSSRPGIGGGGRAGSRPPHGLTLERVVYGCADSTRGSTQL